MGQRLAEEPQISVVWNAQTAMFQASVVWGVRSARFALPDAVNQEEALAEARRVMRQHRREVSKR